MYKNTFIYLQNNQQLSQHIATQLDFWICLVYNCDQPLSSVLKQGWLGNPATKWMSLAWKIIELNDGFSVAMFDYWRAYRSQ